MTYWRERAVLLYERWHWTPTDVLELDVEDFAFYLKQVEELFEADRKAAEQ